MRKFIEMPQVLQLLSTFTFKFCPPKGAKPQKGSRPDTLYQYINCDMCFNLHYQSRTGKKVENEDRKLEREVLVLLALKNFNLDINKSSCSIKK